jgi:hypothetical protein
VSSGDWELVPDASFFAFLWWKREIQGKKKRKRVTVHGIPIPGLPSLSMAKREIRRLALGQWGRSDGLDQVVLPLGKQAQLFALGHFPIGKVWSAAQSTATTTQYASRIVPLATALTWLTVNAERNELFAANAKVAFLFLLLVIFRLKNFYRTFVLNSRCGVMEHKPYIILFLLVWFSFFGIRNIPHHQIYDGWTHLGSFL